MNQDNNTVVSAEMLEELRKAGLDEGYTRVPQSFEAKVREILRGKDIADIPESTKNDLKRESEEAIKAEIEERFNRPFRG